MFLNVASQNIVQADVRLDAVNPMDLRDVIAGKLIAATGTDFEDRAMSFCDEFRYICLELSGGNARSWKCLGCPCWIVGG